MNTIPTEVKLHIFSYVRNPLTTSLVCQEWNLLSKDDSLYRLFLSKLMQTTRRLPYLTSYEISSFAPSAGSRTIFQRQFDKIKALSLRGNAEYKEEVQTRPPLSFARYNKGENWLQKKIGQEDLIFKICPALHAQCFSDSTLTWSEDTYHKTLNYLMTKQQEMYRFYNLDGANIKVLDPAIRYFSTVLAGLNLANNKLATLPTEIGLLRSLECLYLSNNQLTGLPDSITNLTELDSLDLSSNDFYEVPMQLLNLKEIRVLNLSDNPIEDLCGSISKISELFELYINGMGLKTLPQDLGCLRNLTELHADRNSFTSFPGALYSLPKLEILSLNSNSISEIPMNFSMIQSLRILRMSRNTIREFSTALTNLPCLEVIDLSENQIDRLPNDFGRLYSSLCALNLSENHLLELPSAMTEFENLITLLISGNSIKSLTLEFFYARSNGVRSAYVSFEPTKQGLKRKHI